MVRFLIDANLPLKFALWNDQIYVHQFTLDSAAKDEDIWLYAKANNLTIITKDADFSNRILFNEPPPKVIHIRVGNMKMNDFHSFISSVWQDALELNKEHKLVNVYLDRIEGLK